MPAYKLYYFDSRGRAEYTRYLFALAGVEYEDRRITKEEWPTLKPKMPFGQVPVLEIEGQEELIAQSYTILRYLGKELGFYGSTPEDALRIDMLIRCQEDFNKPLITYAREKDPSKREMYKKNFEESFQPKHMEKFETILRENNGGNGWFVGDGITVADIAFLHGTSWPMEVFGMITKWEDYPKLKSLKQRLENEPRIKEWIQNRPKSLW